MSRKKVSFNKVVLEKVDTENIQENIRRYGKTGLGPYKLKCYPNQSNPDLISVMFKERILGRVPDKVTNKLALKISGGKKYIAWFRKLIKSPKNENLGIMVNIVPARREGKMTRNEMIERARNKSIWYKRYSRKWY